MIFLQNLEAILTLTILSSSLIIVLHILSITILKFVAILHPIIHFGYLQIKFKFASFLFFLQTIFKIPSPCTDKKQPLRQSSTERRVAPKRNVVFWTLFHQYNKLYSMCYMYSSITLICRENPLLFTIL